MKSSVSVKCKYHTESISCWWPFRSRLFPLACRRHHICAIILEEDELSFSIPWVLLSDKWHPLIISKTSNISQSTAYNFFHCLRTKFWTTPIQWPEHSPFRRLPSLKTNTFIFSNYILHPNQHGVREEGESRTVFLIRYFRDSCCCGIGLDRATWADLSSDLNSFFCSNQFTSSSWKEPFRLMFGTWKVYTPSVNRFAPNLQDDYYPCKAMVITIVRVSVFFLCRES